MKPIALFSLLFLLFTIFYSCNDDGGFDPICTVGASCDDFDSNTIRDRYNANCDCVGDAIEEYAIVIIDTTEFILNDDSSMLAQGIYEFQTTLQSDIKVGDVIVGAHGEGFIRWVTTIENTGGGVRYNTTQATMEDVFENEEFNTSFNLADLEDGRVGEITFDIPQTSLYSGGPVSIELTGGQVTVNSSDVLLDWDFEDYRLSKFDFDLGDPNMTANFTIKATAAGEATIADKTKVLKKWIQPKLLFVGGIPVVVTYEIYLIMKYKGSVSGEISSEIAFNASGSYKLASKYNNGVWSGTNDCTNCNTSLNVGPIQAPVGFSMDFDLFPRFAFKVYAVTGPFAEIGLAENISGNVNLTQEDWDFAVSAWLKSDVGAFVDVFGETLGDFRLGPIDSDKIYYRTPFNLELVSGNNQEGCDGLPLVDPIVVKVTDEAGLTQSNAVVKVAVTQGGGSVFESTVYSDENGLAEIDWFLGDGEQNELKIDILKADGSVVKSITAAASISASCGGEPNCSDGIKNGDETGVDCGGSCVPCGDTFTDPRDGQTYDVIEIGAQNWMAENLNFETGNSWCYDYSSANCDVYGRLYDWETAKNVCPEGWHLPTDDEWTTLTDYLGGEEVAGGKMKEAGTAHWESPNTGATNESGFTGLPAGVHSNTVDFYNLGYDEVWWSATEYDATYSWMREVKYHYAHITRGYSDKDNRGFSVRCVLD